MKPIYYSRSEIRSLEKKRRHYLDLAMQLAERIAILHARDTVTLKRKEYKYDQH